MSVLSKLIYQNDFSELEKEIANYIIKNKDNIATMKLVDLAKQTYTSTATISRLCKKIGAKDFNSFKMCVMKEAVGYTSEDIDFNYPFNKNDSNQAMISKIVKVYQQTIYETKELLDETVFNEIVDQLYNSKEIYVFSWQDSYLSALLFQ